MTFGDKLKQLRCALDMSQEELARVLDTSKQVISRYERGERTPKLTVARDYALKLNVSVEDLIDDSRSLGGAIFRIPHSEEQTVYDRMGEEMVNVFEQLSPEDMKRVLDFALGLSAARKP